jgi:hypothetical protein
VQLLARERSAGAECNGHVGSLTPKRVPRDLRSRGPEPSQLSPRLMFEPPFLAPVRAPPTTPSPPPLPPAPRDTLVSDWMRTGATCEREWGRGAGGRGPTLGGPREEPPNGGASRNYLLPHAGQATNFPTNLM